MAMDTTRRRHIHFFLQLTIGERSLDIDLQHIPVEIYTQDQEKAGHSKVNNRRIRLSLFLTIHLVIAIGDNTVLEPFWVAGCSAFDIEHDKCRQQHLGYPQCWPPSALALDRSKLVLNREHLQFAFGGCRRK